jgi:hypothetical protein
VKQYGDFKVKNAFLNSVYFTTEYSIGSVAIAVYCAVLSESVLCRLVILTVDSISSIFKDAIPCDVKWRGSETAVA